MKAEYVEINGRHYSQGYVKSHPEILRPNPPAGVRAEKPKPNQRSEGENSGVGENQKNICYRVTILVMRPRLLDSHDNQRSACKPLVDAITGWLGFRSDDDPRLEWCYEQIKRKSKNTSVLIETITETTEPQK